MPTNRLRIQTFAWLTVAACAGAGIVGAAEPQAAAAPIVNGVTVVLHLASESSEFILPADVIGVQPDGVLVLKAHDWAVDRAGGADDVAHPVDHREGAAMTALDIAAANHLDEDRCRQVAVVLPQLVEHRWYHALVPFDLASVVRRELLARGRPRVVIVSAPSNLQEWMRPVRAARVPP